VNHPDLVNCDESLLHTPQQKRLQQRLLTMSLKGDQHSKIAASALIDLGMNLSAVSDKGKCNDSSEHTPRQTRLQERLQKTLAKNIVPKRPLAETSLIPVSKRSRKPNPSLSRESNKV
jgi:Uma2 family endonuclease